MAAGEEDSARGMAVAGGDGRAPLGSDTRRGKQVGPEEVLDPAAVDAMKRIPSPSGGGGLLAQQMREFADSLLLAGTG